MKIREDETLAQAKARKKKGRRGKTEEDTVQGILNDLKTKNNNFDFDRLLDARAAGRPVPPTVSDFTYCYQGRAGALEVKSTKHNFRLACGDFPQFPRMKRRAMAGGYCLLVVHHTESGAWRIINVGALEEITRGSWDLKRFTAVKNIKKVLPNYLTF